MDEEAESLTYIAETLDEFVFSLEDLMVEVENAPSPVSDFLKEKCGNLKQLDEFLRKRKDLFFVENGKVAVYDSDLETLREKVVRFYEEVLNLLGKPHDFMDLRSYICHAEIDIQDFIGCFYPGETFQQFLLARPDVFLLNDDNTVFLIENESVDYFEQCIENNSEGLHYMKLRDCVGEAPKHIMKFINEYYPEEQFLQFLEKNSDVFCIEDECVYLKHDDL